MSRVMRHASCIIGSCVTPQAFLERISERMRDVLWQLQAKVTFITLFRHSTEQHSWQWETGGCIISASTGTVSWASVDGVVGAYVGIGRCYNNHSRLLFSVIGSTSQQPGTAWISREQQGIAASADGLCGQGSLTTVPMPGGRRTNPPELKRAQASASSRTNGHVAVRHLRYLTRLEFESSTTSVPHLTTPSDIVSSLIRTSGRVLCSGRTVNCWTGCLPCRPTRVPKPGPRAEPLAPQPLWAWARAMTGPSA